MPTLKSSGRELYYREAMSRDAVGTLTFIHGASSSSEIWSDDILPTGEYRALMLDLPGHGQSDPPGRRTIAHYAAVVEDFMRSLGLSKPILVGHSMGSAIALMIAQRALVPARGLILMGASARMPVSPVVLSGAVSDMERVASFVVEHGCISASEEWRDAIRREVIATGGSTSYGDYMACNRFDLRSYVSTIDVPALIMAGRQDNLTPLRFSESLARELPRARLSVLEDTGHYAMIEKPEAVRQLMSAFLRQLELSGH